MHTCVTAQIIPRYSFGTGMMQVTNLTNELKTAINPKQGTPTWDARYFSLAVNTTNKSPTTTQQFFKIHKTGFYFVVLYLLWNLVGR